MQLSDYDLLNKTSLTSQWKQVIILVLFFNSVTKDESHWESNNDFEKLLKTSLSNILVIHILMFIYKDYFFYYLVVLKFGSIITDVSIKNLYIHDIQHLTYVDFRIQQVNSWINKTSNFHIALKGNQLNK